MKTLTNEYLNKIATSYYNNLSHVLYDFDGVETRAEFFKKEIEDNTVKYCVFFPENNKGNISNIRVIDLEGNVVAKDIKTYKKTIYKSLYIAFKHEFTEV